MSLVLIVSRAATTKHVEDEYKHQSTYNSLSLNRHNILHHQLVAIIPIEYKTFAAYKAIEYV